MSIVRAAGGVVTRPSGDQLEVLLVHRPRYDDWTFPKGKVDPGEPDEAAAQREVLEETGLRCALERELASTHYVDSKQRPKVVRYWLMRVIDGAFVPNREVDETVWLAGERALTRLSYEHDRDVLRDAIALESLDGLEGTDVGSSDAGSSADVTARGE